MENLMSKIEKNKDLLSRLQSKRENLDLQIRNLEVRILNQERALKSKSSRIQAEK